MIPSAGRRAVFLCALFSGDSLLGGGVCFGSVVVVRVGGGDYCVSVLCTWCVQDGFICYGAVVFF